MGTSPCACADCGVRFLGASFVFSPAMMAAFISRTTAGVAVWAWTMVAARPVPTSGGGFAMTTTAASTAVPDKTRPPANHWGFGSLSERAGFSMTLKVTNAAASDKATTARRCGQLRAWPRIIGAMTSIGQCHRYHEYDTRPPNCKGRSPSSTPAPPAPAPPAAAQPQPMTTAAPATGSAAAEPGYGVWLL